MKERRLGIVMHGVTGRMEKNQHLIRSILAIRDQGGVALADGTRLMPDPIIVGRNADRIEALAKSLGIARWSADLDAALADPDDTVFFDAASTKLRPGLLRKAIDAGKHVYCEKPISEGLKRRLRSRATPRRRASRTGLSMSKLDLPGLRKLKRLRDFGVLRPHPVCEGRFRVLGFRG